jgi:tight adherence protein C
MLKGPKTVPPLILAAIAALSISLPLLAWSIFTRPSRDRRQTVTNLQRGLLDFADPISLTPDPANPNGFRAFARRLTPAGSVRRLDRLLSRAGRPKAWPIGRLLAAKLILPLLAGALGLLYVSANRGTVSIVVGIVLTVGCYFLPDLLLRSRGQERSQQVALELPDTLDQMTIAVEAGLAFDSAMARAGKNGKGALAEELVRTLQDIQVGQSRRQAYESLAARTGVPDLRKFVRAIIQADMYGISVADVLRTQAAEMRMKRRQRAEEKAMKLPVTILFPLLFFIFPVLFIAILGPAAINAINTFSGQ